MNRDEGVSGVRRNAIREASLSCFSAGGGCIGARDRKKVDWHAALVTKVSKRGIVTLSNRIADHGDRSAGVAKRPFGEPHCAGQIVPQLGHDLRTDLCGHRGDDVRITALAAERDVLNQRKSPDPVAGLFAQRRNQRL
jgi:hypothetical protein